MLGGKGEQIKMMGLKTEKKSDSGKTYSVAKPESTKATDIHEIDYIGSEYQPPEKLVPLFAKLSQPVNATLRVQFLTQLQQTYGNRYVQRVISASRSQNLEKDESKLVSGILSQKGAGRPVEPEVREFMESRFGCDFSNVRTHTDASADKLTRELGANAFTTGRDIFMRSRQPSFDSVEGKRLLGHELAHVVQQSGSSGSKGELRVGKKEDLYEKEAAKISEEVVNNSNLKLPETRTQVLRNTAVEEGRTRLTIMPSPNFILQRKVAVTAPGKVEKGRPRKEIIGTKKIDKRLFMRWLEKRLDVIPKTKPKIMEKFSVAVRVRTYQETSDTITSEWYIGVEAGVKAAYKKILSGAIKGGYKKSWKTEEKKAEREEKMVEMKIPIRVLSREVDRKEVSKYWYEWKRYVGSVEGMKIAVVEKVGELEVVTDLGTVNELGFEIEQPDGSYRQFWPKYYYPGPTKTLETQKPYKEAAAYEAVKYIHERAEKFAEYAKKLFEAGL